MELTENQKPSSAIISLKWGIILAVISFILTVIMKYSGYVDQFDEKVGWISFIFSFLMTITFLYLALKEFRYNNNDTLNYGTGLGICTMIGAISGLVSGAFNYLYIEFIDNGSIALQLEKTREKLEDQGLSESQINETEKMTKMMLGSGVQFVLVVFVSIFICFVLGLIISAVMKREKSIFE
jgi:hypothetical protein